MSETQALDSLEAQLKDFDPQQRAKALHKLAVAIEAGRVIVPPETEVANMHCHSFFSFNAYGFSPSALVWLAKKHGFKLIGMVDFDVLDGVDEFLDACDLLHVRGSTGIETRVFVPEFASREINSPGEPGILYYMGIGFTSSTVPQSVAPILDDLRQRASRRNRGIIERINLYLAPVSIDFERDVMPLAPRGTPTERHIASAYIAAVERRVPDPAQFWTDKLRVALEEIAAMDRAALQNTIRSKLMKHGGVAYVQPGHETFPSVEALNELSLGCGALPCATWLDGFSEGEQAIDELLDLLISKGVCALNIIPDRNWNLTDTETKRRKVEKLHAVVDLARDLALPIIVGTEMNSYGQKLVDDFDAPALQPLRRAFMDGAYFIYGHTVMQRVLGLGYRSAWAQSHWPERRERNSYYSRIGRAILPGTERQLQVVAAMTPEELLSHIATLSLS